MEECFGSFRVEEDYTWRDDIMTVTRRIIHEIDDVRFSNIAAHFDVDLSEIREFLGAKRRKYLAPMTNGDRIRSMSGEELAAWLADHPVVSMYDGSNPQHKAWLDWLKEEEHDEIY